MEGQLCTVHVLDTSAQEEYKSLASQYIRISDAFVIAYDVNDRSTLESVFEYHKQIIRVKDEEADPLPILLVGHDQGFSTSESERVPREEGELTAKLLQMQFVEIFSKSTNWRSVERTIVDMLQQVHKYRLVTQSTRHGKPFHTLLDRLLPFTK